MELARFFHNRNFKPGLAMVKIDNWKGGSLQWLESQGYLQNKLILSWNNFTSTASNYIRCCECHWNRSKQIFHWSRRLAHYHSGNSQSRFIQFFFPQEGSKIYLFICTASFVLLLVQRNYIRHLLDHLQVISPSSDLKKTNQHLLLPDENRQDGARPIKNQS